MLLVLSPYEKITFMFYRHCDDDSPKQSHFEMCNILLRFLRYARNDDVDRPPSKSKFFAYFFLKKWEKKCYYPKIFVN
jgi:hypothetical protein